MALSTCFRRPATFSTLIYKQMRFHQFSPAVKTVAFSNAPLYKTTLTSSKLIPIYNPVKKISTSMVRRSDEKPHDHAKLWIVEKGTTVCLLVLIPCGLLLPNKLIDTLLAVLITAHAYWGMEALVVEYVRVLLFGPALPKMAMSVVYGLTAVLLGGLFFLSYNDIGMCRGFWRIWRNMRKPADVPPIKGKGGSCGCP